MDKEDLLFFYFLHLFANNLSIMKRIEKLMKKTDFSNVYMDYFFGYIFITIGLQAEYALRFINCYLARNEATLN